IYYISYWKNGKKIEERAGRQFQDDMTPARAALIRAQKINNDLLSNKQSREQEKSNKVFSFNDLWEDYRDTHTYLKRLRDQRYLFDNHLRVRIGEKSPNELTVRDIDNIKKELSKTYKPQTVKHVLSIIKRLVNYGVARSLCAPLTFKIEMPKFDNRKTEDLTSKQLQRLLGVLEEEPDQQVKCLMKLALYTGMRKSEMLKLSWNDLDFERGFIIIRDPKGIISQSIPMNISARQVLESIQHTESSYVFPALSGKQRNASAFKRQLGKIKELAGLPKDFRPLHGLRHVFASTLASSGQVDMYTLQKLLTHKSPQMTQRYAHLRDETLKQASNLMGELVEQAISTEKKNVKAG
ncbi:tyrosine-type recombinase/integrase, partial [Candidatus Latescibacterota bacterium]